MIVTISRSHGSRGSLVAEALADKLGFRLVSKELIVEVAKEADVPVSEAARLDESGDHPLVYVLKRAFLGGSAANVPAAGVPSMAAAATYNDVTEAFKVLDEDRCAELTQEAMKEAASGDEDLVVLGRGGQAILADRKDAIHVRIVAPEEARIRHLVAGRGVDEEEAKQSIEEVDARRDRFVKRHFGVDPTDPLVYDVVLSMGRLSIETAAEGISRIVSSHAAESA